MLRRMTDLNEMWVSEHARYDESVFRARETIELYWPSDTPLEVVDVKGYLGDFLVLAEAEPEPDRLWRGLHTISGHTLRHEPGAIVWAVASEMEYRYEQALTSSR